MLLDFLVKAAFDVQVLDDCLDNQVALFQFRQVVFEVSNCDQRSQLRNEKRRRPRFLCSF